MDLIVFGASGHGKVVLDTAFEQGHTVSLVVDDKPACTTLLGVRVVSSEAAEFRELRAFAFVVGIGDNLDRARVFERLLRLGGTPATLIHPRATVSSRATLGAGTVVLAGAVVNAGAAIRENCILNTACSVDHDCVLGPHVHICPGARLAGGVTVAEGTMVGTGAVVIPGRRLGRRCLVGAGAVVIRDVPDETVAMGVPARARVSERVPGTSHQTGNPKLVD